MRWLLIKLKAKSTIAWWKSRQRNWTNDCFSRIQLNVLRFPVISQHSVKNLSELPFKIYSHVHVIFFFKEKLLEIWLESVSFGEHYKKDKIVCQHCMVCQLAFSVWFTMTWIFPPKVTHSSAMWSVLSLERVSSWL